MSLIEKAKQQRVPCSKDCVTRLSEADKHEVCSVCKAYFDGELIENFSSFEKLAQWLRNAVPALHFKDSKSLKMAVTRELERQGKAAEAGGNATNSGTGGGSCTTGKAARPSQGAADKATKNSSNTKR